MTKQKNQRIIGALLLVVSFSVYLIMPELFSGYEFILGLIAAIGLSLTLGFFIRT